MPPKSGMSVQDYVVRTLIRDDFDERFQAAVEETEKFYGVHVTRGPAGRGRSRQAQRRHQVVEGEDRRHHVHRRPAPRGPRPAARRSTTKVMKPMPMPLVIE